VPRLDPMPEPVSDSALAGYLRQAEAILAARPHSKCQRDPALTTPVPERFERLRWFELPNVCLAGGVA
jgi:hypothetical protein